LFHHDEIAAVLTVTGMGRLLLPRVLVPLPLPMLLDMVVWFLGKAGVKK